MEPAASQTPQRPPGAATGKPCRHGRQRRAARTRVASAAAATLLMAALAVATAQDAPPPAATPYTTAQLDQMLAPIALYPDALLGEILMAAGYPLEIVEADHWRQDPAHAGLQGMALAEALQPQSWDASVKALTAFPQLLAVLDNDIEWTEELGEAFIGQQPEVMDRVQQLRRRAEAARTLTSSPRQTVSDSDQSVEITPASPDTVYLPVYDPNIAYGNWPYPDNQPFDIDMAGYMTGGFIAFAIVYPLWGWDHWDWRHHRLGVDGGPGAGGTSPNRSPGRPLQPSHAVPWHHDPAHRGDVAYRNIAPPASLGLAPHSGAPAARGAVNAPAPGSLPPLPAGAGEMTPTELLEAPHPSRERSGTEHPVSERTSTQHAGVHAGSAPDNAGRGTEAHVNPPAGPRPAPPALEPYARGAESRAPEEHGEHGSAERK